MTATRRPAAATAPPREPAHAPLDLTVQELREGVRAVFYPAIPAYDDAGQARVDRAVERLVDAASGGMPPGGRAQQTGGDSASHPVRDPRNEALR